MSNYGVHHLNELEAYVKELESQNGKGKGGEISIGQWELHPWLTRPDIVDWCNERGVICEAYCPLVGLFGGLSTPFRMFLELFPENLSGEVTFTRERKC